MGVNRSMRTRNGKIVQCEVCAKDVYITPKRLKTNKHHTCSTKCMGRISSTLYSQKTTRKCIICNSDIKYKQSHSKKIKHPTCSIECMAKARTTLYRGSKNPKYKGRSKLATYLHDRWKSLERRATAAGIYFSLTETDLIEQYNNQKGLCYYSSLKLNTDGKASTKRSAKYDALSVDRVNPELGYTKNNVVLCLNCVNMFKGALELDNFYKVIKALAETARGKGSFGSTGR